MNKVIYWDNKWYLIKNSKLINTVTEYKDLFIIGYGMKIPEGFSYANTSNTKRLIRGLFSSPVVQI